MTDPDGTTLEGWHPEPTFTPESGEAKCDHSGSVNGFNSAVRGIGLWHNAPSHPRPYQQRIALSLERIAVALERAYPEPSKRYAPPVGTGARQWESCHRFHPDEECKPGQNHPSMPGF